MSVDDKLKTYFNWSSGKDASMALHRLLLDGEHKVDLLLSSVNAEFDRVSMHGLRRTLLEEQARSIGIPLRTIELPEQPSMDIYAELMESAVNTLGKEGFTHSAFGDIFLEDLRTYRESQLAPRNMQCVFPIWKQDTKTLIQDFIKSGFKAILICVSAELLDETFVGREIDDAFLKDLPANVDPCGENGEFHTFCYDGPIFSSPVKFKVGEKVFREYAAPKQSVDEVCSGNTGFWFCDLEPIG